jgi:hypothetical protein
METGINPGGADDVRVSCSEAYSHVMGRPFLITFEAHPSGNGLVKHRLLDVLERNVTGKWSDSLRTDNSL